MMKFIVEKITCPQCGIKKIVRKYNKDKTIDIESYTCKCGRDLSTINYKKDYGIHKDT